MNSNEWKSGKGSCNDIEKYKDKFKNATLHQTPLIQLDENKVKFTVVNLNSNNIKILSNLQRY